MDESELTQLMQVDHHGILHESWRVCVSDVVRDNAHAKFEV